MEEGNPDLLLMRDGGQRAGKPLPGITENDNAE